MNLMILIQIPDPNRTLDHSHNLMDWSLARDTTLVKPKVGQFDFDQADFF